MLNLTVEEVVQIPAYNLTAEEVVRLLQGNIQSGLSTVESTRRNELYGPNMLPDGQRKPTVLERIWEQANSVVIWVLLVGGVLSVVFHHYPDAIVILAVIIVNISFGYYMEGRAQSTTDALKKMMSAHATALRDDERRNIDCTLLTIGDIFFLQAGDIVPADARVLQCVELSVQESALTGESHAVLKTNQTTDLIAASHDSSPNQTAEETQVPLAERTSMVFAGSQVLKGTATCIVTAIGANCEVGKISGLLKGITSKKTDLTIQLDRFGTILSAAILVIAAAAFGAAMGRGYDAGGALSIAIGIAVAAIPEGLPSCVIITFGIGVYFMAQNKAILKTLPAVETLGSIKVICSDKTGTLTMNKMTVRAVVTDEANVMEFNEKGRIVNSYPAHSQQEITTGRKRSITYDPNLILQEVMIGILCNDSSILFQSHDLSNADNGLISTEEGDIEMQVNTEGNDEEFLVEGDPTESCIVSLAINLLSHEYQAATHVKTLMRRYKRVNEVPFDSSTKYMATLHVCDSQMLSDLLGDERARRIISANTSVIYHLVVVKGAPEKVFDFVSWSSSTSADTSSEVLRQQRDFWTSQASRLASNGMRVLGLAYRLISAEQAQSFSSAFFDGTGVGLQMLSLVGIMDPPRPEAIEAVAVAQQAGIVVKMITGDHPLTAGAIGRMMGIIKDNHAESGQSATVVTGAELDRILQANTAADGSVVQHTAFDEVVLSHNIFARTTPEHKLLIVQSLQRQNLACAMTGDGVNDAPALSAANIGVAMGITGTEVAKDAAKMILTDDNFSSIVKAIEIGRCIYNNIIKILIFVLPTNGGQAFSIIMAIAIGMREVPITALQILWVNMITSVTLGLVLAFEKPHAHIMQLPPRRVNKQIFGRFLTWRVFFVTTLLVLIVLGNFEWERVTRYQEDTTENNQILQTISVNTLSVAQVAYLFNCRLLRENPSNFQQLFGGNHLIFAGIIAVAIFQAIFTYAPPLQYVFKTRPIDGVSWGKAILLGFALFIVVELEKFVSWHFFGGKLRMKHVIDQDSSDTYQVCGEEKDIENTAAQHQQSQQLQRVESDVGFETL